MPAPNHSVTIREEFLAITLPFCPNFGDSFIRSFGAVGRVALNGGGVGHLAGRRFAHFGVVFARASRQGAGGLVHTLTDFRSPSARTRTLS
jgi:hypothetical protein